MLSCGAVYYAQCTLIFTSVVKSGHLYLGRVAQSATGWCQKGPCLNLRPHDKNLKSLHLSKTNSYIYQALCCDHNQRKTVDYCFCLGYSWE